MSTFFLKSKFESKDWMKCDDCGGKLSRVYFWNPKKKARIKNICEDCNTKREEKKPEAYRRNFA